MAGWSRIGFTQVSAEVYERRGAACLACPNLVEPPPPRYPLRSVPNEDLRVCKVCGAVASRMARLPTENCPAEEPGKKGLSLWGEPMTRR